MFNYLNNHLVISEYTYKNKKIPKEFNNFTIIHISDLHETLFGENQCDIMKKIKSINPNIIVMTGDMLDKEEFSNALTLINKCVKICPVYFVEGNHEYVSKSKVDFYLAMIDAGVNIIDNRKATITICNQNINLCGCAMHTGIKTKKDFANITKKIQKLNLNKNEFNIMLLHRPEFINFLSNFNIDLIFSGHAHGGQWRFLNKGIYAPQQGIFPKYTSGIHKEKDTTEIISRGLGNKTIYPRINNYPEIVVCKLLSN